MTLVDDVRGYLADFFDTEILVLPWPNGPNVCAGLFPGFCGDIDFYSTLSIIGRRPDARRQWELACLDLDREQLALVIT